MSLTNFLKTQNGNGAPAAAATPLPEPQPPTTTTTPEPEPEKIPGIMDLLSGQSGGAATGDDDGADGPGAFDSITEWIEREMQGISDVKKGETQTPAAPGVFSEPTTTATVPAAPTTPQVRVTPATDPLGGAGIEISVEIYVEILEAVVSSLAAWYSGDNDTEFAFEKKMKARYAKVAEIYAKSQNVTVSPGFLFGAFTLVIIGQVGMKAHKRKNDIIRARNMRREMIQKTATPKPSGQYQLFPDEKEEKSIVINKDASIHVPDAERMRKDWQVDGGYYVRDANGVYIPKKDRKQKPSPELYAFMQEFYSQHLQWPSNKHIKTFLKTM